MAEVYRTVHGWVAADDAGWTNEIYETEAEARAAVGLEGSAIVSDEDRQELEKRLAALPPMPRAFVEGYGEGTAGYKQPEKLTTEPVPTEDTGPVPMEGYTLNLTATTNRVCLRCGVVVADFLLHDEFHVRVDPS